MNKVIVLFSGGLDSTVLLNSYVKRVVGKTIVEALCFNYGSKHGERERAAARLICAKLDVPITVILLPFINSLFKSDLLQSGGDVPEGHYEDPVMERTIVPYRNTIMLSIAAGYANSSGVRAVAIACHKGDAAVYPDCREEYFIALNEAFILGADADVHVFAPFVTWSKAKIVLEGAGTGAPLELSWSCYKGGEKHCGKCGTCVERKEAFKLAKVEDPTIYES